MFQPRRPTTELQHLEVWSRQDGQLTPTRGRRGTERLPLQAHVAAHNLSSFVFVFDFENENELLMVSWRREPSWVRLGSV